MKRLPSILMMLTGFVGVGLAIYFYGLASPAPPDQPLPDQTVLLLKKRMAPEKPRVTRTPEDQEDAFSNLASLVGQLAPQMRLPETAIQTLRSNPPAYLNPINPNSQIPGIDASGTLLAVVMVMMQANDNASKRKHDEDTRKIDIGLTVTLMLLPVSLFVILSKRFSPDAKTWAYAAAGLVAGYWLKG